MIQYRNVWEGMGDHRRVQETLRGYKRPQEDMGELGMVKVPMGRYGRVFETTKGYGRPLEGYDSNSCLRDEVWISTDLFIQELRLSYVQIQAESLAKRDTILGQIATGVISPKFLEFLKLGNFEILKIFTNQEQLL